MLAAATGGMRAQQITDPNPGHTPDAVLDNHRPLLSKKDKAPTSRIVSGQVVDGTGTPLEGALVILTNDSTKDKREFFTKKGGRYSFEELSFNIDYEVQARYKNSNSEARKLSQYDKSPKMVRILQINSDAPTAPAEQAKKDTSAPKQ